MTLRVQATGSGPLSYQWRLNGVNIPGANNASFPIAGFQSSDSGDYSVAVSDDAGAVSSAVARVREKYPPELPFTDNMNGRNTISGLSGTGVGSNVGATREPGEPNHAGKHGANSIWVTWTSGLLGGVVTLDTAGSSFDTLLAVYTGDSVSNLTLVAANDDDFTCSDSTRAFHTSKVRFNARARCRISSAGSTPMKRTVGSQREARWYSARPVPQPTSATVWKRGLRLSDAMM